MDDHRGADGPGRFRMQRYVDLQFRCPLGADRRAGFIQIEKLQMELGRYVDEMLARMVLGEVAITEETKAEFLNGLEQRGVNDMIAFWQEIADR